MGRQRAVVWRGEHERPTLSDLVRARMCGRVLTDLVQANDLISLFELSAIRVHHHAREVELVRVYAPEDEPGEPLEQLVPPVHRGAPTSDFRTRTTSMTKKQ